MVESKTTQALHVLTKALLGMRAGSHIERVGDMAHQAGVGAGTMHKALQVLINEGVVTAVRVQRYGTTIEALDYARLWKYAGNNVVRGILPMPLSAPMEGLASAVTEAIAALGLEAALVYREGASRRVAALEAGQADFTVLSGHALHWLGRVEAAYEFGSGSYYGDTGIFQLRRRGTRALHLVAADGDSPDHRELVRAEFPDARLLSVPMRRIPALIASARLDATVWYGGTAVPVRYVDQLTIGPASSKAAVALSQSPAVIVTCPHAEARELLGALDKDLLRRAYEVVAAADPEQYPFTVE